MADLVLDVPIAPEGAVVRLRNAINKPPRRSLFGLMKVAPEFVGVVRDREFEIWERSQHAIHARGEIRGRRGGSRIEARLSLNPRTRVLSVVFFGVLAALAVALAASEAGHGLASAAVTLAGALVIGAVFVVSARRQREALRRFVTAIYEDVGENQAATR